MSPLAAAAAGPLPPAGKLAFSYGIVLLEQLLEAGLIMLLLHRFRFRLGRLAPAYLAVSLGAFLLLLPVILPAFKGNVLLAKIFVIVLETGVLFTLTNLDWFRRPESRELSLLVALAIVTVGTVTALYASVYLLFPLEMKLLKFIIQRH